MTSMKFVIFCDALKPPSAGGKLVWKRCWEVVTLLWQAAAVIRSYDHHVTRSHDTSAVRMAAARCRIMQFSPAGSTRDQAGSNNHPSFVTADQNPSRLRIKDQRDWPDGLNATCVALRGRGTTDPISRITPSQSAESSNYTSGLNTNNAAC